MASRSASQRVETLVNVDADYAAHVPVEADIRVVEQEEFAAPGEQPLLAVAGTQASLGSLCAGDEEAQHWM